MLFPFVGNKAFRLGINVSNGEASASIPRGTPLVFKMDTGNEGLTVVLPATAGAAKTNAVPAGIATKVMAVGDQPCDAIAYGYVPYALLARMTRAASTDSWTSSASIASYGLLSIDTVNNALSLASASAASNLLDQPFVLLDSVASAAASASATSDTRTVITTAVRAFVRMF